MRIENLTHHPGHLMQVANWHFSQWQHLYPGDQLEDFAAELRASLGPWFVPSTWLLVNEQGVWGSASVIEQDMATNPDLGPWLASVYIHPELRGQGLGTRLVRFVITRCQQQGLSSLYLFTPDRVHFYQNLGWQDLRQESYQGVPVHIMTIQLEQHDATN